MEPKYCSYCGAELKPEADVCTNCGKFVRQTHVRHSDTRSLIEVYKDALSKYAVFDGRATLREYWLFVLVNVLVMFTAGIVMIALAITFGISTYSSGDVSPFMVLSLILFAVLAYIIYPLAMLLPSIAISVRRLHDQNKSGYFWFLNLIPGIGGLIFLILMIWPGDEGENDFGFHPLDH